MIGHGTTISRLSRFRRSRRPMKDPCSELGGSKSRGPTGQLIGSQTPKAPSSCRIYDAVTLKCGNSGRLLSRRESQRGRRKRGGQARGSDNSSAPGGRGRRDPERRGARKSGGVRSRGRGGASGREFAAKRQKSPRRA